MKEFHRLAFDFSACRDGLRAFEQFLQDKADLDEGADIKPFFEAHPQLITFIGNAYGSEPGSFDLWASQYQLFGDFSCDLVCGDSAAHNFGFIELEAAKADSLFRRQGRKATPEWAGRLERGFSQILDWFWKLDDMARTDEFQARFGARHGQYFGLLVIGRDAQIDQERERRRFEWRSRKAVIDGKPVRLVTYDQLCRDLSRVLDHFSSGRK